MRPSRRVLASQLASSYSSLKDLMGCLPPEIDKHQHSDGRLVLWTTDNHIMFLNVHEGISIADFPGKRFGYLQYSDALKERSARGSRTELRAFLSGPAAYVLGIVIPVPGLNNLFVIDALIDFLKCLGETGGIKGTRLAMTWPAVISLSSSLSVSRAFLKEWMAAAGFLAYLAWLILLLS